MTAPARRGMTFESAPDVLRVDEAAGLARCGSPAIYAACRRGNLRSVKIGNSIRIPKKALATWLRLEVTPLPMDDV